MTARARQSRSEPREMILIEHLPFETDAGIGERARIGLIVLASDFTIEHEWRAIFAALPGVALYESRLFNDPIITPESLRAMEPLIAPAASLILPGTPLAAFTALGAKRIAVLTPYRAEVNQIVADYITARGFEVPVFGSFNEGNDRIVAAITPASIKAGIRRILTAGDVDAVFVSCTSVRLAEVAAAIEAEVGLPVTSSNHAMAWHALRLAGIQDGLPQFGKLFTLPIA